MERKKKMHSFSLYLLRILAIERASEKEQHTTTLLKQYGRLKCEVVSYQKQTENAKFTGKRRTSQELMREDLVVEHQKTDRAISNDGRPVYC